MDYEDLCVPKPRYTLLQMQNSWPEITDMKDLRISHIINLVLHWEYVGFLKLFHFKRLVNLSYLIIDSCRDRLALISNMSMFSTIFEFDKSST